MRDSLHTSIAISMGVRGIRIDAAKHQDAGEMEGILNLLDSNDPSSEGFYIGMEVIGSAGEAVQPSMYYTLGQVTEFAYADSLDANIIPQGKMIYLNTLGESWGLMPDSNAIVFLGKHTAVGAAIRVYVFVCCR